MHAELPRLDLGKAGSVRPVKDRVRHIMDIDAEVKRRIPLDDAVAPSEPRLEMA